MALSRGASPASAGARACGWIVASIAAAIVLRGPLCIVALEAYRLPGYERHEREMAGT